MQISLNLHDLRNLSVADLQKSANWGGNSATRF